ncbi:MAG: helix-turn-helix transcriptional regulator [Deltaproteobacteria bacterium]|nr:helix-turn-helix transcriptional regulator [Deltaproteobacteria bacterium]
MPERTRGRGQSARRAARRRRRRSPEEARRLLLDAAEALMAARGPDAVTLRDVAEAVGVTPGLVTHYFGTYAGLAQEVIRRQDAATRRAFEERMAAARTAPDAGALLSALLASATDPRRARLFAWTELRRRGPRRASGGLGRVVDALRDAFRRTLPAAEVPPRQRIEAVALLALAATHGWAIGRRAWVAQFGRPVAEARADRLFLAALVTALRLLMAAGPGR